MSYSILLVDDDKSFREEFRDCFLEYRIIEAKSGEEALNILTKPNTIDLVFLDVRMPGMNGLKILKKMKELNHKLIIVILTGYSTKDVAIEALKGRADEYIEKPINIDKTKEIIKTLLDIKENSDENNSGKYSGNINNKLEYIKNFIKRNYDKKISLNDVAREVFLSPKYLSRIFKENTGTGFNEYKLEIKINKAKEMLISKNYDINQISEMLGYQNTESFIKIFKKNIGLTPTEYSKQKINYEK